MKTKRIRLALAVFALGISPVVMSATTCSLKEKLPSSARIFAKADDQSSWREYTSAGHVPDLQLDSGMSAEVVQHKKGIPSVTVVRPGEQYWTYTRYCFAGNGHLDGVSFEVRTQLGWGYRVEGTATGGGFSATAHEFFRTKDGKTIEKPEGVADAPAGLAPTLYMSVSELPFAGLLKPPAKAKSGRHAGMALVSAEK
jgi:hypothetical protein